MEHLFLGLHLVSLLYLGGTIVRFSYMIVQWLRAATVTLDKSRLLSFRMHYGISLGLTLVTGVLMFLGTYDKIIMPYFLSKLLFVGILVANGLMLRKLFPLAVKKSYREFTKVEKRILILSTALFGIAWLASAALAGFILSE